MQQNVLILTLIHILYACSGDYNRLLQFETCFVLQFAFSKVLLREMQTKTCYTFVNKINRCWCKQLINKNIMQKRSAAMLLSQHFDCFRCVIFSKHDMRFLMPKEL